MVLFPTLNQSALANGADKPAVVTVGDVVLSRSDLVGAATSVAERIRGARRIAVLAEPTAQTVVAIVGALIAGVAVVPVPPDSGTAEREHILPTLVRRRGWGPRPLNRVCRWFRCGCTRGRGTAIRSRTRTPRP